MPRLRRRRRRRSLGGPALAAAEPLRQRRRKEAAARRRRRLGLLLAVLAVVSAGAGAVLGRDAARSGAPVVAAGAGPQPPAAADPRAPAGAGPRAPAGAGPRAPAGAGPRAPAGADPQAPPAPSPPAVTQPAPDPPPPLETGTAPLPDDGEAAGVLPTVRPATRSPLRVRVGASLAAGLAFDLDSGRVLWQRMPRRTLPIASLTKVMTALLVVERTRPRDVVRVSHRPSRVRGSKMGFLRAGRRVRVEPLLHGLLMASGNDAAIALAEHVAGSERAFVAQMNERARLLGLRCTRYVSVHGLGRGDRSCPADLARLAVLAMAQPRIAAIARKRSAQVRIGALGRRWLGTTNPLLQRRRPGVLGLKTGWTPRAGRCLIAVQRVGGRRRAVVLLRSADPGRAAERVFAAAARAAG